MAKRPTASQRRKYAALTAKLEPELRAAFEASVRDLKSGVEWSRLIEALEGRDIEAAIRALNIDQAAFYKYASAKTAAFAEAGALTTTMIDLGGGASIGIRFDMSNPGAENWIRQNVGQRIAAITQDQIAAVRETIQSGYAAGRHPTSIGRDLAGRVVNGTRQGGVIGLDAERARRLTAVTRGMETAEGVQDLVRGGKVRYKVNPATEARILKAHKNGTAVSVADREISKRQYGNSLLKARGDTIARTETAEAVRGAQIQAWEQVLNDQGLPPEAVEKTWIHGGPGKDPRPHHVAANGMTVQGLYTPFVLSNGVSVQGPHTEDAPADEKINCSCSLQIRRNPSWGMEEQGPASTAEEFAPITRGGETVPHPKSLVPQGATSTLAEISEALPDDVLFATSKAMALVKKSEALEVYTFAQHTYRLAENFRADRLAGLTGVRAFDAGEAASGIVLKTARAWRKVPPDVRGNLTFADYAQIRFWSFRGNDWMLHGTRNGGNPVANAMQARMAQAADKWNARGTQGTVFRGVTDDVFERTMFANARQGDVITLNEMTATTQIETIARRRFAGDVILQFDKAKGRNIDPLAVYQEAEVLLPPGQRWRVVSIVEEGDVKKIRLSPAQ